MKTQESDDTTFSTRVLFCNEAYVTSGSFGALELNFSALDENGNRIYLKMNLLYIDKFNIIYNRLENYKYEFVTDHIDCPVALNDSDFQDMYSFFERLIHSYFWLETFHGSESLQREYFGHFTITVNSIYFENDSLYFSADFTADNHQNVYFSPSEITGSIKVNGLPVCWKMVD
ncbi:MAG: hypothetical protein JW833_08440 [Prolixibacteraceae bacterium]|nr:hypothetical protein [Prolixibacteraceae bacterium]